MSRGHARVSPSMLSNLQKCLRFKFHETDSMKDAGDEGTLLHHAAETGDMRGLDEYQIMDVQKARDYVASLRASCASTPIESAEKRVTLLDLTYGHPDLVIVDVLGKTLHILDYKFTRTDSSPGEQLRAYGAAAFEMMTSGDGLILETDDAGRPTKLFKLSALDSQGFSTVTHVVAPRLEGPPVVESYDSYDLLTKVRADIEDLYARYDDPWLPPNPEFPELCARCARASRCPAVNHAVATVVRTCDLQLPAVLDPATMVTPGDYALGKQISSVLKKWCELVDDKANEFAAAGNEVPGYRQQTRSNGFKVPRESTGTALAKLKETYSLEPEMLFGAMTISVPEMSKQLACVTTESEIEWKARIMEALKDIGMTSTSTFLVKMSKKAMKELGK